MFLDILIALGWIIIFNLSLITNQHLYVKSFKKPLTLSEKITQFIPSALFGAFLGLHFFT